MKKLTRSDLKGLCVVFPLLNEKQQKAVLGGTNDDFTWEQAVAMMDDGTWTGGYVDGIYMGPCTTIYGSSSDSSNSGNTNFWDNYVTANSWLTAAIQDLWSVADPVYGYISSGSSAAYDIYNYHNGTINSQQLSDNLVKDALSAAPMWNSAVNFINQSVNYLNELEAALERFFNNPALYYPTH